MSRLEWIAISFPLHSIHQHQADLLRSSLLMSFSSSKSAPTPHCQWVRYMLRSLAFKALRNCTQSTPYAHLAFLPLHFASCSPHCNAVPSSPDILLVPPSVLLLRENLHISKADAWFTFLFILLSIHYTVHPFIQQTSF